MNEFSTSNEIEITQVIKNEPELLIDDNYDDSNSMEFTEEAYDQNVYEIKADIEDNESSGREFLTESESEYQTNAEEFEKNTDEETDAKKEKEDSHKSKLHSKNEYDLLNLLHVCPICGDEFENENQKAWRSHLTAEHELNKVDKLNFVTIPRSKPKSNDQYFKCTICEKVFVKKNLGIMKRHAYSHMPFQISKCKICGTGYSGYKFTPCNCQDNNNDFFMMRNCTLLCSKCDAPFEDGKQLKIHMGTEHNIRLPEDLYFRSVEKTGFHSTVYECTKCQLQRSSRGQSFEAMLRHAVSHDKYRMYQCNHCKKTYLKPHNFKHHEATCEPALLQSKRSRVDKYIKLLCPACGHLCTSQKSFEEHIKREHSLVSMKRLNVVKEKDEMRKRPRHKCKVCDHVFEVKSMTVYQNHAFQHMPYKMFNCGICDQGFDAQLEIAEHLKAEHNVDIDVDPDIDKNSTKCQTNLNMLFMCPVCNVELESKDAHMQHINKEHQLNTTLKGLSMKEVVIYDRKGAEVKKVYECLECGKQIGIGSTPTQRLQHRMSHLPFKPYKCKLCKKLLSHFKYLREHVVKCKAYTVEASGVAKELW